MNKKLVTFIFLILVAIVSYRILTSVPVSTQKLVPENVENSAGEITYSNATADLITVDLPSPAAIVGKDFSVIGKARGAWFFEASFPIRVLDKDGNVLVAIPAQAQGEWMTNNFVPFKADLKIPTSYVGPATLVLTKDNASGLPEHDAYISFPINIEY